MESGADDPSELARGRLAVLSAHLAADLSSFGLTPALERSPALSVEASRPSGNLGGSMTVIDERTVYKYVLQVSPEGTVKAPDFKKISTDGDEGMLRYRGYPIEELAESNTFLEVAYLLMRGNLPSESQLSDWEFAISQYSAVPQDVLVRLCFHSIAHDAHPIGVLASASSALSVFHPDANPALRGQDPYNSKHVRDKQIVRVLGKVPTIAASAYLQLAGRPPVLPPNNFSYLENFLYMLESLSQVRVLDILFILHAEHEMNCSTAAVRHLASSGVDVFSSLAGAVGARYCPLHGGANENEIEQVKNIPGFIEGVKNRKWKLSGFGHRVYKNYDPCAKVAVVLEKTALSDDYFIKRKLYSNVDFYSGLIYRAMGFPTDFFPVLFAISRMADYLTHCAYGIYSTESRSRDSLISWNNLFVKCEISAIKTSDKAAK
ncbi:hypothetical protein OPV22_011581 [Ensete ventricosum]|uniref:Citrate synthase n=1 Tax=Ensete ventricosum TaxID=4639 RepID=A0AAV8RLS9_ENSVE|nr:hypothetical protein OPV22_011581 [Ensete ventricosum]